MIRDLNILAQSGAMARHASERHRVIAENIANADTPGYKARALPSFDAQASVAAHRGDPSLAAERMWRPTELKGAPVEPNGNSVSLEDQMMLSADAQAQHSAALAIYRKSLDILRLSVRIRT